MTDVTQIRIGKLKIGIVGLKTVLEETADLCADQADEQIGNLLLETLSKQNYIPSSSRDEYLLAFLREYKKYIGEPVTEPAGDGLQIKVLGQGCLRCERLERDVMSVMSENGITGDLEHVRDLEEINSYGVMGTPALIINAEVKAVGIVPSKSRIKTWLVEASAKQP